MSQGTRQATIPEPIEAPSGTRLSLTPEHLEHIHAHARRTYPEECCGVLVGRRLGEGGGFVVEKRRCPFLAFVSIRRADAKELHNG